LVQVGEHEKSPNKIYIPEIGVIQLNVQCVPKDVPNEYSGKD
jgi:hypothetical protein